MQLNQQYLLEFTQQHTKIQKQAASILGLGIGIQIICTPAQQHSSTGICQSSIYS